MSSVLRLLCLVSMLIGKAYGGTTANLGPIFLGRCYDYNETIEDRDMARVETPCLTLWQLFQAAFAYKPGCGLDETAYLPFLEVAWQPVPIDKTLLWSGTYGYVHRLSEKGRRYVTMEDTLTGYLADSLTWCGQSQTPGIDYSSCPEWNSCDGEANALFWRSASHGSLMVLGKKECRWQSFLEEGGTKFAQQAEGEVYVLLDGSNPTKPAYRNDSVLASIEIHNLNASKVSAVNVMLMNELGKPQAETCTSGSLITLQNDVVSRNLQFRCQENPDEVVHLLCLDQPDSDQCQVGSTCVDTHGGSHRSHPGWIRVLLTLTLTFTVHGVLAL